MAGKLFRKNSTRFLTAFNQIDKFFSEQLRGNLKSNHFYEKVDAWYDMGFLTRRQFYDLLQFSRLRNAIVHEYFDDEAIAEPNPVVVKRIESLKANVCRPKKLHELFRKQVITADVNDRVEDVLDLFWTYKISQIPVVDNGRIVNVLNTNTIAWWTAVNKPKSIPNAKVSEVLSYNELQENFRILPKDARLPEAVRLFRHSYSRINKGWFMDAIVITADGNDDSALLGIIVLEDLVEYLI